MPKTEYLHVPGVTLIDNEILSYKGKYYDIQEIQDYLSGRYEEDTPVISRDSFKNWMRCHKFEIYDAFRIVDDILYERTEKMNLEEKLHALSESDLFKLVSEYCEDNRYSPVLYNEGDPSILGNDVKRDYSPNDKFISVDGYGFVYSFNDLFIKASETDLANYLNSTSKFDYLFENEGEGDVSLDDASVKDLFGSKKIKENLEKRKEKNKRLDELNKILDEVKKYISDALGIDDKNFTEMINIIKDEFPGTSDNDFYTKFKELSEDISEIKSEKKLTTERINDSKAFEKYWTCKGDDVNYKDGVDTFVKEYIENNLPENRHEKYISLYKKQGGEAIADIQSAIKNYKKKKESEEQDENGDASDLMKIINKLTGNSEWIKDKTGKYDDYQTLMEHFEKENFSFKEAYQFANQISKGRTENFKKRLSAFEEEDKEFSGDGEGEKSSDGRKEECNEIIKNAILEKVPSFKDYEGSWNTFLKNEGNFSDMYIKSINDFIDKVVKRKFSTDDLKQACIKMKKLIEAKKIKYVKGRHECLDKLGEALRNYNINEKWIEEISNDISTKIAEGTIVVGTVNKNIELLSNLLKHTNNKFKGDNSGNTLLTYLSKSDEFKNKLIEILTATNNDSNKLKYDLNKLASNIKNSQSSTTPTP